MVEDLSSQPMFCCQENKIENRKRKSKTLLRISRGEINIPLYIPSYIPSFQKPKTKGVYVINSIS